MDIQKVIKRDGLVIINPDIESISYREGDANRFSRMVGLWIDAGGVIEEINKTLVDIKSDAISEVKKIATDIRAKLTGYADQYQLAGWVGKSEIAKRVIAGTATVQEIASIQAEADRRGKGEDVNTLAQNQYGKSTQLTLASAVIDGLESAAIRAISEAETPESLTLIMGDLKNNADAELALLLSAAS